MDAQSLPARTVIKGGEGYLHTQRWWLFIPRGYSSIIPAGGIGELRRLGIGIVWNTRDRRTLLWLHDALRERLEESGIEELRTYVDWRNQNSMAGVTCLANYLGDGILPYVKRIL